MHAFRILDTDDSKSISFKEFEVQSACLDSALEMIELYYLCCQKVWGIYQAMVLLHHNEILLWELRLQQKKRELAKAEAADANSRKSINLMIECRQSHSEFLKYTEELNTYTGFFLRVDVEVLNVMSIALCIAHACSIAFYNVKQSQREQDNLDWVLRAFASVHFCDAMLRLNSLLHQAPLTTQRKQVRSERAPGRVT